jgi:hypothetical protein
MRSRNSRRFGLAETCWLGGMALAAVSVAMALEPVPTTINDFHAPGTQPLALNDEPVSAVVCSFCHGSYSEPEEPYTRWNASMMGQAGRDPVFHAALANAGQDASFSGDTCLRCHVPQGWLVGHSTPTDGSLLQDVDFEGVACSICHRMVDPVYTPGMSPPDDQAILAALTELPFNPHSANYVIDPSDRRRGPFDLQADWLVIRPGGWPGFHQFRQSPFHLSSRMCATCHDVSLPHFSRQPDSTYTLNELDTPAPTDDKYQQFPEQRTYSEWSQSLFAQGPVNLGGRFGGNQPAVSSCQDCHLPTITGQGCAFNPPVRDNLPQHNFNGGNTWVLRAINQLYFQSESGLSDAAVDASVARAQDMLQKASDLELFASPGTLTTRIINFTGHKLPTGYNEGRRMWINVKFLDPAGQTVAEMGSYDPVTAVLSTADTKVYEARNGVDPAISAATGIPIGPGFHLAVNNTVFKDNRIPPMGFNNASFAAVQAGHVGYSYTDGQYWDDTAFAFPPGVQRAMVTVYYQTTSKEYIEFLRDHGTSGIGGNPGQNAYDMWLMFGKSVPVAMDSRTINLLCPCDFNADGLANSQDFFDFLNGFFAGQADFNVDGITNSQDFFDFLNCFFTGCP